jgi:hypothetical protein
MLVRLARRYACSATDDVIFLQRQHQGVRAGGLPADQIMARWMEEQSHLFNVIYDTLDLSEYLPGARRIADLARGDRREALIGRGVVMARKKLWAHAVDDFCSACRVKGAPDCLTPIERAAVKRALFSKYGSAEFLTDTRIAASMRALAKEGPIGREIAHAFARSIVWFVRTNVQAGRIRQALRYTQLAASMALA